MLSPTRFSSSPTFNVVDTVHLSSTPRTGRQRVVRFALRTVAKNNERQAPAQSGYRLIISEFLQSEPVLAPLHQVTAIPFVP